jgi:mRNA interferase MazF
MPSTCPKPAEIWKADLGLAGKVRWFIVISRYDPSAPRALSLAVPITTKFRQSQYEVPLGKLSFFREESFANVQGLTALEWTDFQNCLGRLPSNLFEQVRQALRFVLELQ